MNDRKDTLLEFPCDFHIKAMGHASVPLNEIVLEIVRRHLPNTSPEQLSSKDSRQGNYVSITANLCNIQSKEQLDAIYIDLNACEHIVMVL